MKKKQTALLLVLLMLTLLLCGCAQQTAPVAAPAPTAEPVTLTIAGGWPDCRAIDVTAKAFTAQYPNCTIVYEYVQDYYPSLVKRMSGENPVDLFITSNIQAESDMLPFALELCGRKDLDLSHTFDGLLQNFMFRGGDTQQLYAVPLGADLRGMYVNLTLLKSLGLEPPTDQQSLLAACETLKQNGYIPFQGNPGNFGQMLVYPWISSIIANAEDPAQMHDTVAARGPGVSELFREPIAFLYSLPEKGYYDYKRGQTELDLFNDASEEAYARYFLNIRNVDDQWVKQDDKGLIAFMPSAMSLDRMIAKTKADHHSQIEYAFMLAPVGPEGGYAYLSPAHGIAACNRSANIDWAVKFLDFLFQSENNKAFAEAFNVIPNTQEAFSYLHSLFDVPDDRISHLGEVTFEYGFYELITPVLVDVSKINNPKYMLDDGAGNLSLHPLDEFMGQLEDAFQQH